MTIIDRLAAITAQVLRVAPADVSHDAHLIDELGLDSFAIVDLILSVEDEFPGFDFSDTSIAHITTLRELAAYLDENQSNTQEVLTKGISKWRSC